MLLGRKGAGKSLRAAQGAGKGLRPAYCLTLLSETRRKSPGKRPAGGQRTKDMLLGRQGHREGARQVAKGHAARPPRAPGRV